MDVVNELRIRLAEEMDGLPTALQSSYPDLGVDFLYHVFSDVMEEDAIDGPFKRKRDELCAVRGLSGNPRGSSHQPSPSSKQSDQEPRMTRSASKKLRSLSDATVGELDSESDGDVTATTCEVVKDDPALQEMFGRALKHIDRIREESIHLEEAALSVGARNMVETRPLVLVCCPACGKTIDQRAVSAHEVHCQRKDIADSHTKDTRYTNDTATDDKSSQVVALKSNIAPINTSGLSVRPGVAMSPVAISMAAHAARQSRSFNGRPSAKIEPVISPKAYGRGHHPIGLQYAMPGSKELRGDEES
jgi:hypothetical protein